MLIIVRHGRTDANASGLLLGRRLDPGLDALGQRQAAALRSVVGHADRVISSPLRRTRETAEAFGLPVEIEERWVEIDYGTLDGVAMADVPPDVWSAWRRDIDFLPGGGESLASVGVRVRGALDELLDEARDRNVVVVTHVSPIKAAVAWALGTGDETVWRMYCAPASVSEIGVMGSTPSLRAYNVTAHLDAL